MLGQTWFNDAIYFTGFIECGLERYGAYADVCKIELGLQDKQVIYSVWIIFVIMSASKITWFDQVSWFEI